MATRNIVPRATGEGSIGTSAKTWGAVYADDAAVTNSITAATFTGDLTGNVTGDVTGDLTGDVAGATKVSFTTQGEIGFRNTTHTNPSEVCKQVVATAGTVDSDWVDGNAKLCLHTYDSTGTNTAENGSFVLQADDGTNGPFLEGRPNGSLKWNNHNVITSEMTGEIKRVSGNSSTVGITVTLCSITSHAAGNWLIVGHIDLNTSINNAYNTVITIGNGNRVVRGTGLSGGGQCCVWIKYLSANETVSLQGYIPSSATMRGTLEMIRLA